MSDLAAKTLKVMYIGSDGLPNRYGGFETLVEQIATATLPKDVQHQIIIQASSSGRVERPAAFGNATLLYSKPPANGVSSILYDFLGLIHAVRTGVDVVVLLGVSGALFLPAFKLLKKPKIVTNLDGLEWRRHKWGIIHRCVLRMFERIAIQFSDALILDNRALKEFIPLQFQDRTTHIPYGGDQAINNRDEKINLDHCKFLKITSGTKYAFKIARIEPENNIHLVLEAAHIGGYHMAVVGDWKRSDYSKALWQKYHAKDHIRLIDSTYDLNILYTLRRNASVYIHGHSVGGTNPALVEAMFFDAPIVAFDCPFNRCTTSENAKFFTNAENLSIEVNSILNNPHQLEIQNLTTRANDYANRHYLWADIAAQYSQLVWQVAVPNRERALENATGTRKTLLTRRKRL